MPTLRLLGHLLPLVSATAPPKTASTATSAGPHPAAPASLDPELPPRCGSTASVVDRVADFYGAYIDAIHDSGRGRLAEALRTHYLTPDLRKHLVNWEDQHHADGVLHAGRAPDSWQVVYNDSGMGHAWSRVRLTWGDAEHHTHVHLVVQSDLATTRISGIRANRPE